MTKKYELTNETLNYCGHVLHRIKALINFGNVKAGQLGGWIESEDNLSQYGYCWVSNDAKVFGNAKVYGSAEIYDNAEVFDNAKVYENACIHLYAEIYGNAEVYGNAVVSDQACVSDDAKVYDKACVSDNAKVYGHAQISGHGWVYGHAKVWEDAQVYNNAEVFGYAEVSGEVGVFGNAKVCDKVGGNERLCGANEKVYDDNSTPKNNTNMEKKYKVSIDITMSTSIYVDAENEEKAKQKAIEDVKKDPYFHVNSADSCVNCVVTNIVNEDENVRLWLISQLKIKSDDTDSDKNDMINKALDYLERQGGKSVK